LLHEGEPDAAGDASSPLIAPEAVVGMAVYSASAMLQGIGRDVWEMMVENIP
jgi:pyruvate dehydrogenase (quinone)